MPSYQDQILTPYDIKHLKLKNRLAVAPMTRVSATVDGLATSEMAQYYERFAKGGFGLIFSEGLYTDQKHSQGYPFQPGISEVRQAGAWRPVIERIHAQRSVIFAQVMHAGALSQGNRFVDTALAPSDVRPKGSQMKFYYGHGPYRVPQVMSDESIADAINGFVSASELALNVAGFDGLEIHGANGYLLDQFLTDYSNQRTDKWGGDVSARIGLTLEVIKAVKAAVGGKAPVGVRISQGKVNDFEHKWPEREGAAEVIFGSLDQAGIDFIHVTEYEAWKPAFEGCSETLVELANRYAPNATIIANGGLHVSEHAAEVVRSGADIISIGKSALANPDLPNRLKSQTPLADFDGSILNPIANIKDCELALGY
ncbi:NADH:flavin oxidoreductase [Pseudomonas sp. BP8]|uniref:oxidoreductase n=1 Tax=Pseudomonas sp. BP8 TaxID=2817864 RepID=UPI001AE42D62|nr:NADH:flavin oxidoreductase [Pseudomonas sp. BP8]MBP2261980.1 2,4-dienoyl-CoA reductase-like NADH-dependent reductase (Old Yellow Enzyme family) [Pseudomonas sp. BP8]HDS1736505.1 NADH:flavin oxidoreductase [Pseudomonas putida]